MLKHYLMIIEDTSFWLVGPFESHEASVAWGTVNRSPGGPDDPRWQTVRLLEADVKHPVRVVAP